MRANQFTSGSKKPLDTFLLRIRLPQVGGYTRIMEVSLQARNHEMARRVVRAQYGDRAVIVGNPKKISN